MIYSILPKRGTDDFGSGAFEASRGNRRHKGIDYACYPGTIIQSPVIGTVTKLGYPYSDDLSFRYVEITSHGSTGRHRLFYVEPSVELEQVIKIGDIIGHAQDIAGRYNTAEKTMKNHIHYEIISKGRPLNPEIWHDIG